MEEKIILSSINIEDGRMLQREIRRLADGIIFDDSWIHFVSNPDGFLQVLTRGLKDSCPRNDQSMPFPTSIDHTLLQRPSSTPLTKESLVSFPKPMTAYANPGALLKQPHHPAD